MKPLKAVYNYYDFRNWLKDYPEILESYLSRWEDDTGTHYTRKSCTKYAEDVGDPNDPFLKVFDIIETDDNGGFTICR